MGNQLKARIALQGDTKDLMNKLQRTKAKANETSASIHKGFSKTASPLNQMNALLGGNNEALNTMSGSVSGVGTQLGKLATANPILLGMTAAIAAAKIAYDELKRSVEDYTEHTEAGMDSLKAHNKALEEAVSVTRRLKEERSGMGAVTEEARQDVEAAWEVYKAGTTLWQKVLDGMAIVSNNYASAAWRNSNRAIVTAGGMQVYNKVKTAQDELLANERQWYRFGKLRVENLRTEAEQLLLIANDKTKSDAERKKASGDYQRKIEEAYQLEQTYLSERARLIKISNEDSADDLETVKAVSDAQQAVMQLTKQYVAEKRKVLRVNNEIDRRANAEADKLQEQIDKYFALENIAKRLDDEEQQRLDKLNAQNKAIEDAWKLIDDFDWGDENAEDTASFDLADMVRTDGEKLRSKVEEMNALMNQYINEILVEGIAGTIENAVAAAFNPDMSFLDASMLMLADFAKTFGKMLIAHGVAIEAFKKSWSSGVGAIAAGIGLVASGAAIKGFLSKKSKSFNDGGIFNAHYGDQLVARLNPTEMVLTPQQQSNLFNMLKMGSNPFSDEGGFGKVVFEIGHDKLTGVLEQGTRKRHRNG